MPTISLRVPSELNQRLTDLAEQRGVSRSAIIREALQSFADQSGESAASRAGHLVGSLEGPRDLSTNPRHMQGFGR